MANVLAISSHVVRGHVGLAATVPALQWLGHEVWALPTVLLASRPGLGRLVRREVPAPDLAAMLYALESDGCWASLDAVLAGYFPSAQAVTAAAEAIRRIVRATPGIPVLVDPILGDGGRLYVAQETAEAIRRELLPLATIATPNLFELQWLTGGAIDKPTDPTDAARRLGPDTVVVTSTFETRETLSTVLVTSIDAVGRMSPLRAGIPNGAGDLFAGLFLGHLLAGRNPAAALDAALADLDRVLAASTNQPVLKLKALDGKWWQASLPAAQRARGWRPIRAHHSRPASSHAQLGDAKLGPEPPDVIGREGVAGLMPAPGLVLQILEPCRDLRPAGRGLRGLRRRHPIQHR
jgi:pyridoxine kinase